MITVGFIEGDLERALSSLRNTGDEARSQILDKVPRIGAIHYRDRVADAILTQKYAVSEWEYSEKYAQWKSNSGMDNGYWRLAGDLVSALSISRMDDGWFSGIPENAMDSGGKSYGKGKIRSIAWYGKIIEWGGVFQTKTGVQIHKPRPVFMPSLNEFAATDWPRLGAEALNAISKSWE
jgi:hypothetical protein